MPSPESVQIRSYLLAPRAAQGAPVPLSEQRASFDVLVENYVGHPIPLPQKGRVSSPWTWMASPRLGSIRLMPRQNAWCCICMAASISLVHSNRIVIWSHVSVVLPVCGVCCLTIASRPNMSFLLRLTMR